jgi:hypothetical protein
MKNLLALIGALVVGFAVAGWYLGWYQLGFTKTSDGNLRVETNVNTKKVVEDSGEALKKAGAFVGDHLDKTAADASTTAAQQPAPAAAPAPQDKDAKVSIFGIDLTPQKK